MAIEQSVLFNFGILLFGGILVFLLGFVFYLLAFQSTSVPKQTPISPSHVEKKSEKQVKQKKAEKISAVKENDSQPAIDQVSKNQGTGVAPGASSRMPDLLSLGIKENQLHGSIPANHEQTTAVENVSAKIDGIAPLPGIQKEKDVVNALGVFGSQTGTAGAGPKDEKVLPEARESIPAVPHVAIPSPAPFMPVTEKPMEEKSKSLMDMFADDQVEETECNKVAKNLEQIDIHDLLEESQNLINNFTRRGS